jgi:ribosomal protein L35
MKLKTRKSVLKRFKIKKTFVSHKKAFKSHLLGSKNSKRLRNLRKIQKVHSSDIDTIKKSIIL